MKLLTCGNREIKGYVASICVTALVELSLGTILVCLDHLTGQRPKYTLNIPQTPKSSNDRVLQ